MHFVMLSSLAKPSMRRGFCVSVLSFVFMYFLLHCEWASALSTPMSSSWNYNPHAYLVPYAQCNTLKLSFFNTIIRLWNCILVEAYTSEHLHEFLSIASHLFFSLPNYILYYLLDTLHLLATANIVYHAFSVEFL